MPDAPLKFGYEEIVAIAAYLATELGISQEEAARHIRQATAEPTQTQAQVAEAALLARLNARYAGCVFVPSKSVRKGVSGLPGVELSSGSYIYNYRRRMITQNRRNSLQLH